MGMDIHTHMAKPHRVAQRRWVLRTAIGPSTQPVAVYQADRAAGARITITISQYQDRYHLDATCIDCVPGRPTTRFTWLAPTLEAARTAADHWLARMQTPQEVSV